MKIHRFDNINRDFKAMQSITLTALVLGFLVMIFSLVYAYNSIQKEKRQIYVLTKDGSILLSSSLKNSYENRVFEIINQSDFFHHSFFALDPDVELIKNRIQKALAISDNSVLELERKRQEKLFYHNIVNSGISLNIKIDSVQVLRDKEPYFVRTYCTHIFIRQTNKVVKNLITEMYMRNMERSIANAHGLYIFNFRVLHHKNKDANEN